MRGSVMIQLCRIAGYIDDDSHKHPSMSACYVHFDVVGHFCKGAQNKQSSIIGHPRIYSRLSLRVGPVLAAFISLLLAQVPSHKVCLIFSSISNLCNSGKTHSQTDIRDVQRNGGRDRIKQLSKALMTTHILWPVSDFDPLVGHYFDLEYVSSSDED